jgi:AraC family transcriptional regulator
VLPLFRGPPHLISDGQNVNTSSPKWPEPVSGIVQKTLGCSIDVEHQWRCPGYGLPPPVQLQGSVLVSRWTRYDDRPVEVIDPGNSAYHCVGLNLKCTEVTFTYAGRTLVQGRLTAGRLQVTAPGTPVSAVFQAPSDVLHLFISQRVLAECFDDLFGRRHRGEILIDDPTLVHDPAIERLGQALAVSQSGDMALGKVFADSVSLAIVSRLVSRHFTSVRRQTREAAALPQWRMSRVVEYVDAHLSEAIGLADIAESAGLTRMHFAAQFRRATGLRPHEYLLRRRIEHAQSLLRTPRYSIIDVALSCGFRSQGHFTTVFKHFVGETPYRWRVKENVSP